jgi:hypothetical protein
MNTVGHVVYIFSVFCQKQYSVFRNLNPKYWLFVKKKYLSQILPCGDNYPAQSLK